mmetsp:Transcript_39860/g.127465  ORF Transcript_39860/g.127465 Transcript_39860/m.127465 type:complete len:200 (+) Transcript_39860:631-1230(+)
MAQFCLLLLKMDEWPMGSWSPSDQERVNGNMEALKKALRGVRGHGRGGETCVRDYGPREIGQDADGSKAARANAADAEARRRVVDAAQDQSTAARGFSGVGGASPLARPNDAPLNEEPTKAEEPQGRTKKPPKSDGRDSMMSSGLPPGRTRLGPPSWTRFRTASTRAAILRTRGLPPISRVPCPAFSGGPSGRRSAGAS